MTSAKAVLDLRGDVSKGRGHFSRLWSEEEWAEHYARVEARSSASEDEPTTSEASQSDSELSSATSRSSDGDGDAKSSGASAKRSSSKAAADLEGEAQPGAEAGVAVPVRPETNPSSAQELADAEALELDGLSDVSENSDIFHVEAEATEVPRTAEDRDLERIANVQRRLRRYPLLPPDPDDSNMSFADVDSCVRLPTLHCAFTGCNWTNEVSLKTHWEMEKRLFEHLRARHAKHEMQEVFAHVVALRERDDAQRVPKKGEAFEEAEKLWRQRRERHEDPQLRALAYYVAAICEQERQHMPLIGPSVDRRTLTLVCRLARSETLRGLACFTCA